jgi:hypothetical protein
MFKKSLPAGVIFIMLLVALVTMGIAYGAWTQQLYINGNASTGTFDVRFDYLYTEYEVTGCNPSLSVDGHTMTVAIANAYPGFHCAGGYSIRNLGTIPAKINGLVQTFNDVPAAFITTPPGLVWMSSPTDENVTTGESFTLAAGATAGGVMWDFTIPATETGHEGESYTFTYTFLAEQAP